MVPLRAIDKLIMKRIIAVGSLWCLFIPIVFPQNRENTTGGDFVKRDEYNLNASGYNFDGKNDMEKLFFGNLNAPFEFIFYPFGEHFAPCGFRIIRTPSDTSYFLEIKHISNYRDANKMAFEEMKEKQKSQIIDIPVELINSLSRKDFNLICDYNRRILDDSVYTKIYSGILPKYKIETLSFTISNQFAEELYKKMASLIEKFKARGSPSAIVGGYSVTFRTVVEDEVWSLSINMPQGDALKMADLCRQIIEDADKNQLNEKEYIKLLE